MNYCLLDTNLLLKLMKADDEMAFRELYRRNWKLLYANALRKVHIKEIAEEIVQNILVSLWQNRHSAVIASLDNYLATAVKYQVINYIKASILRDRKVLSIIKQLPDEASAGDSDNAIILKELSLAIEKAIQSLPEKTQTVFRLSRLENRTVKDISSHLKISEKAVEYHITKSLKLVRTQLKDYVAIFLLIACLGFIL